MTRLYTILLLLLPLTISAQITSPSANNTLVTGYTNGIADDPIFVFCDTDGNPIGSLTAIPSGGGVSLDFHWEIYDPGVNGFVFYSDELGVSTSTINGLASGGYKVTIKDAGGITVDCFRAWIFIDQITLTIDTILPACQPFELNATVTTIDFNYYNAPSHPFLIDASTEITVCFDAKHTYVSDLGFYLIGPPACGSPRIELAPNIGQVIPASGLCNEGDDIDNLCFSTTSTAVFNVCAELNTPLTGTFASSDPWNAIYGCDATLGGWRIQIYDCIGEDTGKLTGARITFSGNSDCGPNPTVVLYDSGSINSAIKDNSCTAASASIYEVPLSFSTPLVLGNGYTTGNGQYFKWTCKDTTFIIDDSLALKTTVTLTEKSDAWFYFMASDSLGGCEVIDSTFFKYKAPLPPNIDSVPPLCFNELPVALNSGVSTGFWFGTGIADSTIGSFDPELAGIGSHKITYEDPDVCGGIDSRFIIVNDLPIITLTSNNTICQGDSALITFNIAGGGVSPYDLTINNGNVDNYLYAPVTGTFSAWFSPLETDYYFSSVIIDANGCEVNESDTVTITVNPTPLLNVIGDTTICRGDSALFEFELTGSELFNISYDDGSGTTTWTGMNDGDSKYVKPNDSTIYTFTFINDGATPQCDKIYDLPIVVNVNPLPTVLFTGDTNICGGDTAFLRLRRTGVLPMSLTYNDGTNDVIINNILSYDTLIEVSPTVETVYTITQFAYNDDVICEQFITSSVTVSVYKSPTLELKGQQAICSGDTSNLIVNSDGVAPFDIIFFDGTSDVNKTINNSGDVIPVSPLVTTTYILKQLTDNTITKCPNYTPDSLTVIVNNPPKAQLKEIICNGAATAYRVVIDLFDGNMNYNVTGPPTGVIDASGDTTRFTSDEIPTGVPYTFDIDDTNLCGPITISGNYACDCVSDAGTIDQTPLSVCVGDGAFALPNYDYTTDDNDTIVYVLHEGAGQFIVNQIDTNTVPVFYFQAGMNFEQTYYISAVVGDSIIVDPEYVDFTHICTKVSPGVPVIFHDLPTMTMTGDTTICNGETAKLKFTITGKSPYGIDYTSNGNYAFFNVQASSNELVGPLSDSTTYIATKITDGNGCENTSTDQVQVNVNPIPTTILSTNTPSYCFGDSVYLVFTSTGNGPWVIDYTDGANNYTFNTNDFEDSVLVKDVVTTNYTLTQVSDNTTPACVGTTGSSVNFTVNPTPTAILSGSTAICAGTSATINITTSGNADFLITIDDQGVGFVHDTGANGNSFVVTPNDTTTYTIVNITDGSTPTCSSALTSSVTIAVNPLPTLAVSAINDTICEGDSTMFKLHLTSDGPYDVTYNNGTSNTTINNIDSAYFFYVSPSVNTTYTFNNVTDNDVPAPVCSVDTSITKKVVVYSRPQVSFGADSEICQGEDGIIPIEIDGDNPTYEVYYTRNTSTTELSTPGLNASDTIIIPNMAPGRYEYNITRTSDSSTPNKCWSQDTDVIVIQVNPTPRVSISRDTTICAGESLDILFNFPNGIPNYDLELYGDSNTYTLNNISGGYKQRVTPTDSTNYSIQNFFDRTNARCAGIWDLNPVTVNVNPNPTVNFTGDDTICIGQNATLYFEGIGVPNFSYDMGGGISNGMLFTSTPKFQRTVSPEVTTTYRIKKMYDGSARTCTSENQGEVTIVVLELPTATISGKDEVCDGLEVDLQLAITGYAPFDVIYRNDSTGQQYAELGLPKNNTLPLLLEVGSHNFSLVSVQMSDDPYCVADSLYGNAEYRIDPIPLVDFEITEGKGCSPVRATFTNKTDSIFLGECTWDFGFGEPLKSCNKNIPGKIFKAEGSYDIKLVIVSPLSTQCTDSLTKVDGVIVYPKPVVDFDYTPQPVTIENSKVRMLNKTIHGYSYEWIAYNLDGSVLSTSDEMEPYITFPQADEGEYPVWLEATSEHDCKADLTKVIIIEGVMLVNIPNSFTPNGDGINDVFGPVVYGAYTDQDFAFTIYDRWGEEVFTANEYSGESTFWDGTFKNTKAADGTYIYKLVVKSLYSQKIEEFYGEFSLLR